jgi:hypothetical protein
MYHFTGDRKRQFAPQFVSTAHNAKPSFRSYAGWYLLTQSSQDTDVMSVNASLAVVHLGRDACYAIWQQRAARQPMR